MTKIMIEPSGTFVRTESANGGTTIAPKKVSLRFGPTGVIAQVTDFLGKIEYIHVDQIDIEQ